MARKHKHKIIVQEIPFEKSRPAYYKEYLIGMTGIFLIMSILIINFIREIRIGFSTGFALSLGLILSLSFLGDGYLKQQDKEIEEIIRRKLRKNK